MLCDRFNVLLVFVEFLTKMERDLTFSVILSNLSVCLNIIHC